MDTAVVDLPDRIGGEVSRFTVKHFTVKKHARTTHVMVKMWQNEPR